VVVEAGTHASRGRDGLDHGIAAVDYSASGMLLMRGEETLDFLQRITTNDLTACTPGSIVQTVAVSEKAKIVDTLIVLNTGGGILLITGPGCASLVQTWLERFIIMEDITIEDVTGRYACALLLGDPEKLRSVFPSAGSPALPTADTRLAVHCTFFSRPAALLFTIDAESLMRTLSDMSIQMVSPAEFDAFRIDNGIPSSGKELTPQSNPLETGLKQNVSFTKGCYIGQEVIARLETYKKVQRFLCRVILTPCPEPGMSAEIIGENGIHGYITTIGTDRDETRGCAALAIVHSPVVGALFTMNNGAVGGRVDHIFE
jgi:tRNA-modifying protein YgfZ